MSIAWLFPDVTRGEHKIIKKKNNLLFLFYAEHITQSSSSCSSIFCFLA